MAEFDMPLEELRRYRPTLPEPTDFDAFWADTLASSPVGTATFEPFDAGLRTVDSFDVTFPGFGGQPVRGWLHLPVHRESALPCVVEYVGYGGGRGLAHERIMWAVAGFAHFVMDTRGQGSSWSVGETPDPDAGQPAEPGFLTRGIGSPQTYYYRRVFADAARAVDAARSHPAVDASKIAVAGGSQGGGITLAAAALCDGVVLAMPDVPFLCNMRRAVSVTDSNPYGELVRYLHTHRDQVEQVFGVLSYFDGVSMAARATASGLFSVALRDQICPPSTVFAAYNAYAGPKHIEVYDFNEHEGGGAFHQRAQFAFARELFDH
ncbi:MAG TPA: acetylxylan esterase [Acidothermaceae bacterium]|nr:acetylxylan esterase [Acidothermaceae bacterium]